MSHSREFNVGRKAELKGSDFRPPSFLQPIVLGICCACYQTCPSELRGGSRNT